MISAFDRFDTPPHVAEFMASEVSIQDVHVAADFAAGEGRLLDPIARQWPRAKIVATDVCHKTVSALRRKRPKWSAHRVDFLHAAGDSGSRLQGMKNRVDLVLLNPPFSCRGGTLRSVRFDAESVECSEAMAFVLRSTEFLAPKGELLAILPNGTLSSNKDRPAWQRLHRQFDVDVIATNGSSTFEGCSVKTSVVKMRQRNAARRAPCLDKDWLARPHRGPTISVRLTRGSIQMHAVPRVGGADAVPLVHTSNLRDHEVSSDRAVRSVRSIASGPMVLFPRVGQPSISKLVVVRKRQPLALSDCVMSIRCRSVRDAESVYQRVSTRWNDFSAQYGGTCAPYITMSRVREFLLHCKIRAE